MPRKNTTYYILHTTYSKGQALLIVVLVMVVALTVGLGLMSRTTTDIKVSQQQEESARAFSAAEAGIEEALRSGGIIGGPVTLDSGANYTSTVSETGYTEFLFPDEIFPGQTATLWLAEHSGDDLDETNTYSGASFDLCWRGGAVEVSVYYKSGGDYQVRRGAYDPDGARRSSNHFSAPDGGSCLNLANKKTVRLADLGVPGGATLLFANLKPYYSTTKIGAVASGSPFPSQGKEIESIGTLGTITRKVKVFRSWPAPPAIFDYGLFSGSGLVKSDE